MKNYKIKNCKSCGKEFKPRSSTQLYCGNIKTCSGCSYIRNKELNRKHHPYNKRKEYLTQYKKENKGKLQQYWKTFCAKYPERKIIKQIKSSAKRRNLEFNLTVEDIEIPKLCPILKIPLLINKNSVDYCPSVDRIDSTKGYIKGNIMIISNKANRIKNNGTMEEIGKVYHFLKNKNG